MSLSTKPNFSFRLVLLQNVCVRPIDPGCLAVAKLNRLEGSRAHTWAFYADLVMLIPFFPSLWHWRWIAPAAGILWDRQRLAPQGKSTNELRFAVLWLIYAFFFFAWLSFFLLWRMWLVGFYGYFRLEWGNLGCRNLDRLKTEPDKIIRVKRSKVIWIICL